jgi:hypothetical protein
MDVKMLSELNIFTRAPSMGFKYQKLGTLTPIKFQIAFTTTEEYQMCLTYLQNLKLPIIDTNMTQSVFPTIPDTSRAAFKQPRSMSQISPVPTLSSQIPSLSTLPTFTPIQEEPEIYDFLSQVLVPSQPPTAATSNAVQPNYDDIRNLKDEDLKKILKERIKDPGFIKFVTRVESVLKSLQS